MNPKVLISCPISHLKLYCFEEFMYSLHCLTYDNKEILLVESDGNEYLQTLIRAFDFKCETLNSKKKMMDKVVDGRNFIRKYALDNGFDYVLMIDADAILPKDIIEKLLAHNKDFVSAALFGMDKYGAPELVARTIATDEGDVDEANLRPFPVEWLETGLQQISISGMGCVLLSSKLLKDVEFKCRRYENGKLMCSEDYCFSNGAEYNGYTIWLDTDIQVKHLIQGNWNWDKC